jgi:hypothetical protein
MAWAMSCPEMEGKTKTGAPISERPRGMRWVRSGLVGELNGDGHRRPQVINSHRRTERFIRSAVGEEEVGARVGTDRVSALVHFT